MARDDLIGRTKEVLTPALVIHTGIVAAKASGVYVEDISGKRYMDFTSGLATANIGHNHPRVVEAIRSQAERLIHSGCIFYHDPLVTVSESLRKITPEGLDMFFFGNSGAEAVEGALKLARLATGRQGIIAFTGGFHGRTFGSATLTTSSVRYRRSYHPLLPSVFHSPYPYCYRCFFGQRPDSCGMDCYDYLERTFRHIIHPEEVACMIVEPVLGEGGYVVPPAGFLQKLRDLCDRWGILLIFDEVQSGMGRTARWFASEHFGVVPDVMTVAKGIASGMPLSAVVSRRQIMEKWPPGSHGTTFGGNPVSCAAATATIEVIENERLLSHAAEVGAHALELLRAMQARCNSIGDVRGIGVMIGIEFAGKRREPLTEPLQRIMRFCLEDGVILIEAGVDKNVVRLAPPLIVTKEEIERGLTVLENAIRKVEGGS